ncbi:MAG: hypothetical protein VYA51_12845 [Planctomycetota bacterium]|nr:hypothetical protein [Planctomycetota bacterium]
MIPITALWSPFLDRLRTLTDRTAFDGHLPPQDDRTAGPSLPPELPVDRLRGALAEIGFELVDRRQEPRKGRGEAKGTRKISKCTAVLLHQTAAIVSLRQSLGIPAHALVMDDKVVLLHPLRAYLYHSGAGNSWTIGIEINCRAAGVEGDMRTLWRSKKEIERGDRAQDLVQEASDGQLAAARLLTTYYVEEVARQGGKIVEVTYHRLTSSSRVSDPGSRIAWAVGVVSAEDHALAHARTVVGSGKPCPTCWGGELGVPYNWRVRGY